MLQSSLRQKRTEHGGGHGPTHPAHRASHTHALLIAEFSVLLSAFWFHFHFYLVFRAHKHQSRSAQSQSIRGRWSSLNPPPGSVGFSCNSYLLHGRVGSCVFQISIVSTVPLFFSSSVPYTPSFLQIAGVSPESIFHQQSLQWALISLA